MSDDVLVRVENVSKRFCRSFKRSLLYGLQDLGCEIFGRWNPGQSNPPQTSLDVPLRSDEFWAVKDISFELRRGECLGLVGRNGAGKTTLLRMLNGLIKPDSGQITINGSVGGLIALGAGFNPLLTGRENIHVQASIYGIRKDLLSEVMEEIIDFSGLAQFIDSPLSSYSSGMQVRLGFAVASALSPDVLILDEVLAVGDQEFKTKCSRKIDQLLTKSAVIFVSHNEDQLQSICSRGIYMRNGSPQYSGSNIVDVLEAYKGDSNSKLSAQSLIFDDLIEIFEISGVSCSIHSSYPAALATFHVNLMIRPSDSQYCDNTLLIASIMYGQVCIASTRIPIELESGYSCNHSLEFTCPIFDFSQCVLDVSFHAGNRRLRKVASAKKQLDHCLSANRISKRGIFELANSSLKRI